MTPRNGGQLEKKVNHAWIGLTVQLKGQNVEDTRGEYLLKQNSANIPKVPAVCTALHQRLTRPGHIRASAGLNVLRSAARQARPHSGIPQVKEHPSTPLKPEAMGDCHGCGRYFRRSISGGDLCAEKPTDLDEAGSLQREDWRSVKAVTSRQRGWTSRRDLHPRHRGGDLCWNLAHLL